MSQHSVGGAEDSDLDQNLIQFCHPISQGHAGSPLMQVVRNFDESESE